MVRKLQNRMAIREGRWFLRLWNPQADPNPWRQQRGPQTCTWAYRLHRTHQRKRKENVGDLRTSTLRENAIQWFHPTWWNRSIILFKLSRKNAVIKELITKSLRENSKNSSRSLSRSHSLSQSPHTKEGSSTVNKIKCTSNSSTITHTQFNNITTSNTIPVPILTNITNTKVYTIFIWKAIHLSNNNSKDRINNNRILLNNPNTGSRTMVSTTNNSNLNKTTINMRSTSFLNPFS